jgi:hypothetical protein
VKKLVATRYAALARPLDPVCHRRVMGELNRKFDESYRSNQL